jgi:tRNA1Val (adenine37-N6)-methyltransferase
MSNSWFQFKQFRIAQEACAMKVTTDACIQGAWTPLLANVRRVMDVGAGTGLLSLMLAQRRDQLTIDAVELEDAAAVQAQENVLASPWKDRITIVAGDVSACSFDHKFDLIISNPPFFSDSLLSGNTEKNRARHTVSLTQMALFKVLDNNLADDGYASVLLPFTEHVLWAALLQQNGWSEIARLHIRHNAGAAVKRIVSLSARTGSTLYEEELIIKKGSDYTTDFIRLLSPFYLHLQWSS